MATRKPFLHQPRDVAVGGVKRHAAHRDAAAAGVLRPRGQRQLERARRRQRVLVEHLVEVAHAEEHDRVAVLPLRVEVLTHRRRGAGRFGRHRGSHLGERLVRSSVAVAAARLGRAVTVDGRRQQARYWLTDDGWRSSCEYNIEPIGFPRMIVLALDTTARAGSAAIVDGAVVLAEVPAIRR